jgi:hypothetical protein
MRSLPPKGNCEFRNLFGWLCIDVVERVHEPFELGLDGVGVAEPGEGAHGAAGEVFVVGIEFGGGLQ